jgi:hypothetical protein
MSMSVLALGCCHLINTCMPFRRYNTNESHACRHARCVPFVYAAEDHGSTSQPLSALFQVEANVYGGLAGPTNAFQHAFQNSFPSSLRT